MSSSALEHRRQQYATLSAQLARLEDAEIRALLDASEESSGWGRNQTLQLGSASVFVKRLPLTQREYDNAYSTANLYRLPLFYNYGVGSAGFGAFRELSACVKTTDWVLDGEIEAFPLLYHHRILPFSGRRQAADPERLKRYVESWAGDRGIEHFMLDRANAGHELVLFLEHFPFTLQAWLDEHLEQARRVLDELRATVDFLRTKGVLHFDAHYWNVVTDGRQHYLTDWGLVLDSSFELTEQERAFYHTHTLYDYAEIFACLVFPLYGMYNKLPEAEKGRLQERLGLPADSRDDDIVAAIVKTIEQIGADGLMPLHPQYVACVVEYRGVIAVMNGFLLSLQRNHRKDTPYPAAELRRLLTDAGIVG